MEEAEKWEAEGGAQKKPQVHFPSAGTKRKFWAEPGTWRQDWLKKESGEPACLGWGCQGVCPLSKESAGLHHSQGNRC